METRFGENRAGHQWQPPDHRRAAFLRRRAASGWWLVCRLAGGRSGTGDPPAASSHSGPLRLRQCRRRHRAWCRLPSRLVACLVDDVQLPRRPAHDRRPITCSPSPGRGTVTELFREVARNMVRLVGGAILALALESDPRNEPFMADKMINTVAYVANPPELGTVERAMKVLHEGRYVLIPYSDKTHGHFTHY